jgi:hypothetical protein
MIDEHSYSTACSTKCATEMQRLDAELKGVEDKLTALTLEVGKRKPMTINDIKENEEKVCYYIV